MHPALVLLWFFQSFAFQVALRHVRPDFPIARAAMMSWQRNPKRRHCSQGTEKSGAFWEMFGDVWALWVDHGWRRFCADPWARSRSDAVFIVCSMNMFFVYCSCFKCLRGRRCVTEEGVFYRFHRPGGCVSSRSLPEPSHLTARRGGVSAEPTGAYNICDPSSRKCFDRALMSFSELCSIVKSFLGLSSIIKSTPFRLYICCTLLFWLLTPFEIPVHRNIWPHAQIHISSTRFHKYVKVCKGSFFGLSSCLAVWPIAPSPSPIHQMFNYCQLLYLCVSLHGLND